jgi:hypothetical protein
VPRDLLDCLGFEKELGLHSAELNAGVYPYNGPGLAALSKDVESKVASSSGRRPRRASGSSATGCGPSVPSTTRPMDT